MPSHAPVILAAIANIVLVLATTTIIMGTDLISMVTPPIMMTVFVYYVVVGFRPLVVMGIPSVMPVAWCEQPPYETNRQKIADIFLPTIYLYAIVILMRAVGMISVNVVTNSFTGLLNGNTFLIGFLSTILISACAASAFCAAYLGRHIMKRYARITPGAEQETLV